MENYRTGGHTKTSLQVHLVWSPKYRKKILHGQLAVRIRDILRKIATDYDIHIISGKVAVDYVHMFVSHKPEQSISKIVQYLKGASARIILQESADLRNLLVDNHLWARGYLAVTAGNMTDAMIQKYVEDQRNEYDDD